MDASRGSIHRLPGAAWASTPLDRATPSSDCDDEAGLPAYREDPVHRDIIARTIAPITEQRVAVQFRY